ncbi:MAG: quinol:cytochrome C oxidoreductase, partial [Cyclobacteriaceae bacterium]
MIEERYEFTSGTKKTLVITIVAGVILAIAGLLITMLSGGHHTENGDGHATEQVAGDHATDDHAVTEADGHEEGGHHGPAIWLKRLFVNLWINNIFFLGLGLIGIFFFAIQYAAQAGWSAGFLRVPLAFGNWILVAGVLIAVVFAAAYPSHALFHWLDDSLFDPQSENYDKIIAGKSWYLDKIFFIVRMIIFFGGWFLLFKKLS